MIWNELDSRLVAIGLDVRSQTEVFEIMGKRLTELHYCKPGYVPALMEREAEFPTGIDIGGVGVAMPHTDGSFVNRAAIGIAVLKSPVPFVHMATEDTIVPVRIVVMLAVDRPDCHLQKIQDLLTVIQDKHILEEMVSAESAADLIEIIKKKESGE